WSTGTPTPSPPSARGACSPSRSRGWSTAASWRCCPATMRATRSAPGQRIWADRDRELGARPARHADGHSLAVLLQAAVAPVAGETLAGDVGRAWALRHVVGVLALEGVGLVPAVAARPDALAVAVGALETVDRLAVLEPLHDPAAFLLAAQAGAAPDRPVLGIGMPVPHAAAELGVEQ